MPNDFDIKNEVLRKYHGSDAHVVIPDGVWEIGQSAFYNCTSLTSVTIPNSVHYISWGAFEGCTSLTSVIIPDGVIEIKAGAFSNCTNLASVILPNSLITIGYEAFSGCTALRSIVIPDSVKEIQHSVFSCSQTTVVCREDSYIHQYCIKNHFTYIFDYQYEAFGGVIPQGFEKLSSPFLADEEQPFIFISYSHKDRDRILEIIKGLYVKGWRIWYDEGLTIGDSYDKTLYEHVKNCSAFLLFVTENSVNSNYIKSNEIPWANDFEKPIIKCILDEGQNIEIEEDAITATVSPSEIEPALEKVSGLTKGEPREAKGISVVADPATRTRADEDGFAYCVYSANNAATAKTILLSAKNDGCAFYDAIEHGTDQEKLRTCACLIVFLDKAFLSDDNLMKTLTEEYQSGKSIAVCKLETVTEDDLPEELKQLRKMHWLNFAHEINEDMNRRLVRHLQQRGCRNIAVIPGFDYKETDQGITITKYTGMDPKPRIENAYNGKPVTEIADETFFNCVRLKSVVIPDSVKAIGRSAFEGCTSLTSITIPENVTKIGESAFRNCSGLSSITIPSSITKLRQNTLEGCTSLVSVDLPNSVTTIGKAVFKRCTSLSSFVISDSVTQIDENVFCDCFGITSVVIGKRMTKISGGTFENCKKLTSVIIPNGIKTIGIKAFKNCENLKSITIPDGVTGILSEAFEHCTGLTSITLPDSITGIGNGAFEHCTNLCSVVIRGNLTDINPAVFRNCSSLSSVILPESVTGVNGHAVIGDCAFENCTNLRSIDIPNGVTTIGENGFSCCENLTSVRLPDSIIKISEGAFFNCASLMSINIPESVTTIEEDAFKKCAALNHIAIPNSVKQFGVHVFGDCPKLTVLCSHGSHAWKYCRQNHIAVKASGLFKGLFGKK